MDGLCGREPPSRADYSATWSLQEWPELLNSLTALFRLAVGNSSSDEEVCQPQGSVGCFSTSALVLFGIAEKSVSYICSLLMITQCCLAAICDMFMNQLVLQESDSCVSSCGGSTEPLL